MLNIGGKYSLSQSCGCGLLLVFCLKKYFSLEVHSLRANSVPAIERTSPNRRLQKKGTSRVRFERRLFSIELFIFFAFFPCPLHMVEM